MSLQCMLLKGKQKNCGKPSRDFSGFGTRTQGGKLVPLSTLPEDDSGLDDSRLLEPFPTSNVEVPIFHGHDFHDIRVCNLVFSGAGFSLVPGGSTFGAGSSCLNFTSF